MTDQLELARQILAAADAASKEFRQNVVDQMIKAVEGKEAEPSFAEQVAKAIEQMQSPKVAPAAPPPSAPSIQAHTYKPVTLHAELKLGPDGKWTLDVKKKR